MTVRVGYFSHILNISSCILCCFTYNYGLRTIGVDLILQLMRGTPSNWRTCNEDCEFKNETC